MHNRAIVIEQNHAIGGIPAVPRKAVSPVARLKIESNLVRKGGKT